MLYPMLGERLSLQGKCLPTSIVFCRDYRLKGWRFSPVWNRPRDYIILLARFYICRLCSRRQCGPAHTWKEAPRGRGIWYVLVVFKPRQIGKLPIYAEWWKGITVVSYATVGSSTLPSRHLVIKNYLTIGWIIWYNISRRKGKKDSQQYRQQTRDPAA